jgi:hypothetical protein
MGWLCAFLKIYIRAFQQASDMNDDVEEKLLVGDRPKHCRDRQHLKERLAFTQDDFQDVRGLYLQMHISLIMIIVDTRGAEFLGFYGCSS